MIRIVCILLLFLVSPVLAVEDEAFEFSSISQAFESRMSRRGLLPTWVAEYVARAAGLSWEVERDRPDMGKDIRGYVSPNYEYCILSFAHFGEMGQGGPAEYCLIDSSGVVLWERQSTIVSAPTVSNRGLSALFTRSNESTKENRKIELLVIDISGNTLLDHTAENLLDRFPYRSRFVEKYGFSNDGMLFYSTLNTKSDSPPVIKGVVQERYQHTSIFIFDAKSNSHHQHEIGFFNPQLIDNIRSADIVVHGGWKLSHDPATYNKGYVIITNRGAAIEERITTTPSMFMKGQY